MDQDKDIDAGELAKLLGLSEATVRSDLSRRPGRLPPRKLLLGSSRLVWSKKAVLAWIESREL